MQAIISGVSFWREARLTSIRGALSSTSKTLSES